MSRFMRMAAVLACTVSVMAAMAPASAPAASADGSCLQYNYGYCMPGSVCTILPGTEDDEYCNAGGVNEHGQQCYPHAFCGDAYPGNGCNPPDVARYECAYSIHEN